MALSLLAGIGVASAAIVAPAMAPNTLSTTSPLPVEILCLWRLLLCCSHLLLRCHCPSPLTSPSFAQMTPPATPSPKSNVSFLAIAPLSPPSSKVPPLSSSSRPSVTPPAVPLMKSNGSFSAPAPSLPPRRHFCHLHFLQNRCLYSIAVSYTRDHVFCSPTKF